MAYTKSKKPKKPCELPCPKCGGADVHRRLRGKGEPYDPQYGQHVWIKGPWVKESPVFLRKYFARECIVHHCRTCQYEWATEPLKERGASSKPRHRPIRNC